jgi:hypothetical protein
MTLKEKFKQWLDTQPREQIREVQLEVIADDYAIDFLEWTQEQDCSIAYYNKYLTTKELLEIFKKEKGL